MYHSAGILMWCWASSHGLAHSPSLERRYAWCIRCRQILRIHNRFSKLLMLIKSDFGCKQVRIDCVCNCIRHNSSNCRSAMYIPYVMCAFFVQKRHCFPCKCSWKRCLTCHLTTPSDICMVWDLCQSLHRAFSGSSCANTDIRLILLASTSCRLQNKAWHPSHYWRVWCRLMMQSRCRSGVLKSSPSVTSLLNTTVDSSADWIPHLSHPRCRLSFSHDCLQQNSKLLWRTAGDPIECSDYVYKIFTLCRLPFWWWYHCNQGNPFARRGLVHELWTQLQKAFACISWAVSCACRVLNSASRTLNSVSAAIIRRNDCLASALWCSSSALRSCERVVTICVLHLMHAILQTRRTNGI